MVLIRSSPPPNSPHDDGHPTPDPRRSNGSGPTEGPNELRAPALDVAARVLDTTRHGRTTQATRESVAVLLRHSRAFSDGGVRYDSTTDEIRAHGEELRLRVERPPAAWLTWTGYYLAVSFAAFAAVAGQWLGVYSMSTPTTLALLSGTVVLLLASVAYQRYTRIDVPIGRANE